MKRFILFLLIVLFPIVSHGADEAVTDLPENTTPASLDELLIEDVGTSVTQKITVGNLINYCADLDSSGEVADNSHSHTSGSVTASDVSCSNCVDASDVAADVCTQAECDAQDACSEITNCVPNAWDADGDISANEISESKINFSTACAAGNHLYVSGGNLACEADDDTTYTADDGLEITGTEFDIDLVTAGSDGEKKIVARVGSSKLNMEDYQRLVAMYAQMSGGQIPEPTDIINEWIEQEIVYREAKKMNLSLPGLALTHQFYVSAMAIGLENLGTQALYRVFERMNNVS